jgi:hypothetical protein
MPGKGESMGAGVSWTNYSIILHCLLALEAISLLFSPVGDGGDDDGVLTREINLVLTRRPYKEALLGLAAKNNARKRSIEDAKNEASTPMGTLARVRSINSTQ